MDPDLIESFERAITMAADISQLTVLALSIRLTYGKDPSVPRLMLAIRHRRASLAKPREQLQR